MKKIIVVTKDKTHEFEADTAYFSGTLQIIKDHQLIAEFMTWEYWRYVD